MLSVKEGSNEVPFFEFLAGIEPQSPRPLGNTLNIMPMDK